MFAMTLQIGDGPTRLPWRDGTVPRMRARGNAANASSLLRRRDTRAARSPIQRRDRPTALRSRSFAASRSSEGIHVESSTRSVRPRNRWYCARDLLTRDEARLELRAGCEDHLRLHRGRPFAIRLEHLQLALLRFSSNSATRRAEPAVQVAITLPMSVVTRPNPLTHERTRATERRLVEALHETSASRTGYAGLRTTCESTAPLRIADQQDRRDTPARGGDDLGRCVQVVRYTHGPPAARPDRARPRTWSPGA